MAKSKVEKAVDQINELSALELAELRDVLEETWGVSAAAPVAVAAVPGAASMGSGEAEEEKTEFDVILADVGPKKIDVIKAIRQVTSLGLKDAKDLAETERGMILERAGKELAQDAKSKLEAAGATVELV